MQLVTGTEKTVLSSINNPCAELGGLTLKYIDEKTLRILQTMYADQTSSNTEYIWIKIFPSANALYKRYNIKHRCFILLPFLWIKRIFGLIFGNKEKWQDTKRQVEVFKTIDQDDINYERKIRQDFGLM